MIGIVSNTPPFSSMHIQHIEGGFMCLIPPSLPLVARKSSDVATAVHMFMAHDVSSSASTSVSPKFEYKWPDATVLPGSVFHISKVPRVKKGKLIPRGGYMVTYHTTFAGSQIQLAAFNRATVMDRLRQWVTTAPQVSIAVPEPVVESSVLLTLAGMRTNPEMDELGDTVFSMIVQPASQVKDFTSPCTFVARCEDPVMALGIVDEVVVDYLSEELGEDLKGEFAVRVREQYLEFGPRLDPEDEPDYFG